MDIDIHIEAMTKKKTHCLKIKGKNDFGMESLLCSVC